MKLNKSINILKREINFRLKQIAQAKEMIDGSLSKVEKKCGRENCHCATGEKHTAFQLTKKVKGKTKSTHVPKEMVEEVRAWIQEHRRIKQLMKEIALRNEQIIKQTVAVSRAASKNKPRKQD
jgi:hypothetical protein